ncbi:MAG: hypothetical protein ISR93_09275 [SAR324 cluster bacterium]|nr:hypothetical protein [SAR324 cluster bacterium]
MRHLLIIFSILLLSSPVIGQSERPETIIIPVSGIGEIPNSRKQILQNKLTNKLKQYFRIVPQEKYEQVLEQVFEELEYEECSEDTCIMRVQEMLQVENVFHLQLIGEGNDIQLNLKWTTLEEKRNEEYFCEKCSTKDLYYKLEGLVDKLVGENKIVPSITDKNLNDRVLFLRKVNGNWEWHEDGDESNEIKFVGEVENGFPNGNGKTTWPNGGMYLGEHKDGLANGFGTFYFKNGNKYEGNWFNGIENGHGKLTLTDGSEFVGEWKDGKKHGPGTITAPDGRKLIGEWRNGKGLNGVMYNSNGEIISRMVNGKIVKDLNKSRNKNKFGVLYREKNHLSWKKSGKKWFLKGNDRLMLKYEGEIVNEVPNGKGIEIYPNGRKFEGTYINGVRMEGTEEFVNGDYYVGKFKERLPHGQGILWIEKRKSKYVGNFRYGFYSGEGTITLANGSEYIGSFENNDYHGKGTFTSSEGTKFIGTWKKGNPWNVDVKEVNGRIYKNMYVNGKEQ